MIHFGPGSDHVQVLYSCHTLETVWIDVRVLVAHTKEHPQCTFRSELGTAEGGSSGPDENETDEKRADKTAWSRTIVE